MYRDIDLKFFAAISLIVNSGIPNHHVVEVQNKNSLLIAPETHLSGYRDIDLNLFAAISFNIIQNRLIKL